MPRPCCKRRIAKSNISVFAPVWIPLCDCEEFHMPLDQAKAIRLADMGELYQEATARKMGVR